MKKENIEYISQSVLAIELIESEGSFFLVMLFQKYMTSRNKVSFNKTSCYSRYAKETSSQKLTRELLKRVSLIHRKF